MGSVTVNITVVGFVCFNFWRKESGLSMTRSWSNGAGLADRWKSVCINFIVNCLHI